MCLRCVPRFPLSFSWCVHLGVPLLGEVHRYIYIVYIPFALFGGKLCIPTVHLPPTPSSIFLSQVETHAPFDRPTDRPLVLCVTGPPVIHQRVPVLRGDALPRHSHHEGRGPGDLGHEGPTGRVLHGQRYPGASVGACVCASIEGRVVLSCLGDKGGGVVLCFCVLDFFLQRMYVAALISKSLDNAGLCGCVFFF